MLVESNLERPVTDSREYRVVKLANEIEVLLIHDESTDKAAAAMDVNVGSFADPPELPGLAHYLEHLLFMGSETFPSENEYAQYLSGHAGGYNAYTTTEHTNYYFDVAWPHLQGALDRFAPFFICPRFSPGARDREVLAVDSENKKNLSSDSWRLQQLWRSLSNPNHPYSKFSTGNEQTLGPEAAKRLGIDVRDRLIEFYRSHYAARLMKLSILGRESLDELEQMATKLFEQVPNPAAASKVVTSEPVLDSSQLQQMIKVIPVMDLKVLNVDFVIPDEHKQWNSQPASYTAHLIGHEASGSLLDELKKLSLANSLSCGYEHVSDGNELFHIRIELTDEGIEQYELVLEHTFAYITMLKQVESPPQWIFDEVRRTEEMGFKFGQKSRPSDAVSGLTKLMQRPELPRSRLLSHSVAREFEPKGVLELISCLRPDNCRVSLISKNLEGCDLYEKWYGTNYSIAPLKQELVAKLSDPCKEIVGQYRLPMPNPYIPENLEVLPPWQPPQPESAVLLLDQPGFRLWHRQDSEFRVPKARVELRISSTKSDKTALQRSCTELLALVISDFLNDETYFAEVAGLSFAIVAAPGGIQLTFAGFSDKMAALVEKVVDCLRNHKIDGKRLQTLRTRLGRQWKNTEFQPPYTQMYGIGAALVCDSAFLAKYKLPELEKIDVQLLTSHRDAVLGACSIEMLTAGNFTEQNAHEISQKVLNALNTNLTPRRYPNSYLLPSCGCHYRFDHPLPDPENINNLLDYKLEICKVDEIEQRACLAVLAQLIQEQVFNTLRTKEQLGYIVGCSAQQLRGQLWLHFFAQSEESPEYLEQRVDALLASLHKHIANISDEERTAAIKAVQVTKREKFRLLAEEVSHLWGEIASGYYHFSSRIDSANAAEHVTRKDLLQMFETRVLGPQKKLLTIHMHARATLPLESRPKAARMVRLLQVEADHAQIAISDALREAATTDDAKRSSDLTADERTVLAATDLAFEQCKQLPAVQPEGVAIGLDQLKQQTNLAVEPHAIQSLDGLRATRLE